MRVDLAASSRPDKKYMVSVGGKTIHFGAAGMSDFTLHRDPARRQRYLARHRSAENWRDMKSAGFWSRHLLWNKPTLRESIKDTENKFNIEIVRS